MMNRGSALFSTKLAFLILVAIFPLAFIQLGFSQTTNLYVYPSMSNVGVGVYFAVDIRISSVTDLYGWELRLGWDPTLLDAVDVVEGSYLKSAGLTFFAKKINNTAGYVLVDCTLLGAVSGASGSGTLATIQFYSESAGSSALDLYNTILVNSAGAPILHTVSDGSLQIFSDFHDVAIAGVVPSKTIVGQGYSLNINVIIANQGGYAETFNITLNADAIAIKTWSITLESGATATLSFTWGTTGIQLGEYTLSAAADAVLYETDTADNTFIDGAVLVTLPGDVNGDGKVDGKDIALLSKYFGSTYGYPLNADVNNDGKIDGKDIAIAAKHFGATTL